MQKKLRQQMSRSKQKKGQDMDNLIKQESKKMLHHAPIGNYLSDTDPEEYANYPMLS